jgi:hypothetical protein
MTIRLQFGTASYSVPKKSVFELLNHQRDLLDAASYPVKSSVPSAVFKAFVDSLKAQTKIPVTKENVAPLSLLAKEFFLSELISECAAFSLSLEQSSSLAERVSNLERQVSSFGNPSRRLEAQVEAQERDLEHLRLEVAALRSESGDFEERLESRERDLERLRVEIADTVSGLREELKRCVRNFPMKAPESNDGIISYLAKKCGGNVHDQGVVSITSKSVDPRYVLKDIADLDSHSGFCSRNETGQWVCWEFRAAIVRPTRYEIWALYLKSWVVEGSMNGESWTEIDRQTNNQNFKKWNAASFAVSNPADCRFIRLTQTDKNHRGNDQLAVLALEFFGTLSE